jgi:hypothetical protein
MEEECRGLSYSEFYKLVLDKIEQAVEHILRGFCHPVEIIFNIRDFSSFLKGQHSANRYSSYTLWQIPKRLLTSGGAVDLTTNINHDTGSFTVKYIGERIHTNSEGNYEIKVSIFDDMPKEPKQEYNLKSKFKF